MKKGDIFSHLLCFSILFWIALSTTTSEISFFPLGLRRASVRHPSRCWLVDTTRCKWLKMQPLLRCRCRWLSNRCWRSRWCLNNTRWHSNSNKLNSQINGYNSRTQHNRHNSGCRTCNAASHSHRKVQQQSGKMKGRTDGLNRNDGKSNQQPQLLRNRRCRRLIGPPKHVVLFNVASWALLPPNPQQLRTWDNNSEFVLKIRVICMSSQLPLALLMSSIVYPAMSYKIFNGMVSPIHFPFSVKHCRWQLG